MDFNKRVAELCKLRGIQKKDLANILGITPQGLSQSINQQYPQLQTLERIANALGVDVAELFTGNQDCFYCPHCGKKIILQKEQE